MPVVIYLFLNLAPGCADRKYHVQHVMSALNKELLLFVLFWLVIRAENGIYTAYGCTSTRPKGKAMPDIPAWLPLCTFMTGFILGVVITRMMDTPHA